MTQRSYSIFITLDKYAWREANCKFPVGAINNWFCRKPNPPDRYEASRKQVSTCKEFLNIPNLIERQPPDLAQALEV